GGLPGSGVATVPPEYGLAGGGPEGYLTGAPARGTHGAEQRTRDAIDRTHGAHRPGGYRQAGRHIAPIATALAARRALRESARPKEVLLPGVEDESHVAVPARQGVVIGWNDGHGWHPFWSDRILGSTPRGNLWGSIGEVGAGIREIHAPYLMHGQKLTRRL